MQLFFAVYPKQALVIGLMALTPQEHAQLPIAEPVPGFRQFFQSFPQHRVIFPRRSFSAALSSIASARSRFRRAFSPSRPFSRFASLTSMPPYFAFHLQTVASLTPCFRHRSATETPVSCSFRMPMIWSSVNLLRFFFDPFG